MLKSNGIVYNYLNICSKPFLAQNIFS